MSYPHPLTLLCMIAGGDRLAFEDWFNQQRSELANLFEVDCGIRVRVIYTAQTRA